MTVKIKNTTITIEEDFIYTSRLLNNKQYKICTKLDGTIRDLIAKCETICKLNNELYIELAIIQAKN